MRVILKEKLLIVVPENADDELELAVWKEGRENHVLHLAVHGTGLSLTDLGPNEVVTREPINITSRSPAPLDLLSNFAATPFEMDGERYASVESFWQGLKFATRRERREIAELPGPAARKAGDKVGYGATVEYAGESIVVGTWAHWQLMQRATEAKFAQNEDARTVLLATAPRPLTHRTRRDSRSIPGVIMADIWMRLRARLLAVEEEADEE
jgi:predicted NAD-dependent protein-ADP-ribosyltransferase YbiA (DUF1768 family)